MGALQLKRCEARTHKNSKGCPCFQVALSRRPHTREGSVAAATDRRGSAQCVALAADATPASCAFTGAAQESLLLVWAVPLTRSKVLGIWRGQPVLQHLRWRKQKKITILKKKASVNPNQSPQDTSAYSDSYYKEGDHTSHAAKIP